MSFSQKVKEELSADHDMGRHCLMAELAGICDLSGHLHIRGIGKKRLVFTTENILLARKFFTLTVKSFNIQADALLRVSGKRQSLAHVEIRGGEAVDSIYRALKYNKSSAERIQLLTQRSCCRRAYLAGAFLAAGSVSDPGRSYHFEIACGDRDQAQLLMELINSLRVEDPILSRMVVRKKQFVVYVKDGSRIVDLLGLMGASRSLMDMETRRVIRQMRGSVNRRVNCETANINKTVSAAVRQIRDITYIRDTTGFAGLKEPLLEMAMLRLEHPDAALKELGDMLQPPVGKSGVNHRLRRLSEIADDIRSSGRP